MKKFVAVVVTSTIIYCTPYATCIKKNQMFELLENSDFRGFLKGLCKCVRVRVRGLAS